MYFNLVMIVTGLVAMLLKWKIAKTSGVLLFATGVGWLVNDMFTRWAPDASQILGLLGAFIAAAIALFIAVQLLKTPEAHTSQQSDQANHGQ